MTDTLFFIDEDEVLAHHGVKGMKWGVRKQRAASGGAGSTKKRKGLSRKQKAAITGVLGTAAAAGAGYYLHKSGKGKKIAALAKKHGASAKAAASKLKYSKVGKHAEATRLAANASAFKTGHAARSAGFRAKQGAWKVGNKVRRAATGGVSGAKSAAGMAARSAKSKAGSAAGKAASAAKSAANKASRAAGKEVGFRKLATSGTRVVRPKLKLTKGKLSNSDKIALAAAGGLSANLAGAAVGAARNRKKTQGSKKRRR